MQMLPCPKCNQMALTSEQICRHCGTPLVCEYEIVLHRDTLVLACDRQMATYVAQCGLRGIVSPKDPRLVRQTWQFWVARMLAHWVMKLRPRLFLVKAVTTPIKVVTHGDQAVAEQLASHAIARGCEMAFTLLAIRKPADIPEELRECHVFSAGRSPGRLAWQLFRVGPRSDKLFCRVCDGAAPYHLITCSEARP